MIEIEKQAEETSGGNYYYEQGFIFGFELGEENGRKEKCIIEQNKDGQIKLCDIAKENAELKKEIEKRSMYEKHIEYENERLKEQIEKMKCCKEDIINSIKSENADIEWVKAHNGVAKFIYVQTIIDIINDKWELVK